MNPSQLLGFHHIYPLLQICAKTKDLKLGRYIHSLLAELALDLDGFWIDHLIHFYSSCGCLSESHQIFTKVCSPSVYTWNAIISAYINNGSFDIAIRMYHNMEKDDSIHPDKVTFLLALKITNATISSSSVCNDPWIVHTKMVKFGLLLDLVIGNALLHSYAKRKKLKDARKMFDSLPIRDVVSWTSMISCYVMYGYEDSSLDMYDDMKKESLLPTRATFLCVLKACSNIENLEKGKLVYDEIVRYGLDLETTIGNTLVDMFAKCGRLKEAWNIFENLDDQKLVSWAVMISGYAMHGKSFLALELFEKLQYLKSQPTKNTMLCILKACLRACGNESLIKEGRWIHVLIIKNDMNSDVTIGSALVDMYSKCGRLYEAYALFIELSSHDVVSWGSIISGYAQHGQGHFALQLHETMHNEGFKSNGVIFSSVLKACASSIVIVQGRLSHDQIVRHELEMDVVLGNALIDMYIKCGNINEAKKVFDEMPCKDEVSWGAIILGCSQHECSCLVLELLGKIKKETITFGKVTAVCFLKGCAGVESLKHGRWVHDMIIFNHIENDPSVGNNLVDMYVKCGVMHEASKVFDNLLFPDLSSWAIIIAGHSSHGNSTLARKVFEDMKVQGVAPDDILFTNILTACSHAGLLEEGRNYFRSMKEEFGIVPSSEHCSCIVNLLGRAGWLAEAEMFLQTIPLEPGAMLWRSLLTCCRTYCDAIIGRRCLKIVTNLDPTDASAYLLMSDIYSDAHSWLEVYQLEEMRRCASAHKIPGQASIQTGSGVHAFMVGDHDHPQTHDIFSKMNRLIRIMKTKENSVPYLDLTE